MSCQSSLSNALVLLVLERWLFDLSSTATVGVLMYVYPPPWCAWDMIDPLTDNSDISAWYVTPRIRRCSTWLFSRCSSLEPRCCLAISLICRVVGPINSICHCLEHVFIDSSGRSCDACIGLVHYTNWVGVVKVLVLGFGVGNTITTLKLWMRQSQNNSFI